MVAVWEPKKNNRRIMKTVTVIKDMKLYSTPPQHSKKTSNIDLTVKMIFHCANCLSLVLRVQQMS